MKEQNPDHRISYTTNVTGNYRDSAGKSEWWDFKFTRIACIPTIPVIFEVNQKKSVDFLYMLFIKIFQISL